MLPLTKQERMTMTVIFALILLGWSVRHYRLSHPRVPAESEALAPPTNATN